MLGFALVLIIIAILVICIFLLSFAARVLLVSLFDFLGKISDRVIVWRRIPKRSKRKNK